MLCFVYQYGSQTDTSSLEKRYQTLTEFYDNDSFTLCKRYVLHCSWLTRLHFQLHICYFAQDSLRINMLVSAVSYSRMIIQEPDIIYCILALLTTFMKHDEQLTVHYACKCLWKLHSQFYG
jgi:hypothetical protein